MSLTSALNERQVAHTNQSGTQPIRNWNLSQILKYTFRPYANKVATLMPTQFGNHGARLKKTKIDVVCSILRMAKPWPNFNQLHGPLKMS